MSGGASDCFCCSHTQHGVPSDRGCNDGRVPQRACFGLGRRARLAAPRSFAYRAADMCRAWVSRPRALRALCLCWAGRSPAVCVVQFRPARPHLAGTSTHRSSWMQTEQDLTDRARRAMVLERPLPARRGRPLHIRSSAAHGGGTRLIATTVCALLLLACGDERPPWSGFPIVLPDAGRFELSPDLASSLLAAQAALAKQLADQGSQDAGSASMGATSPMGARRGAAGAAAPRPPSADDDEKESAAPDRPEMTPDSMNPVDAGAAADSGMQRRPEMRSSNGGAEVPGLDAGARMPTAGGGPTTTPDAGPALPAAGGGAPISTLDAGMPLPAAGDVAPVPAVDAGVPISDADGGS